jgi:hypothetical protein
MFVGPYLECQYRTETVIETKEIPGKYIPSSRHCPNKHSFKQSSLANFCPVCGQAMVIVPEQVIEAQTKEVTVKKQLPSSDDVWHIIDSDEDFTQTGGEAAFCLEENKGIRHYYVDEAGVKFNEFLAYDFDALQIEQKLNSFAAKYGKQIDKFKHVFGEYNVSLKFGILY